jgi:hypothetical protein
VLVDALFKKFGLFLNTPGIAMSDTLEASVIETYPEPLHEKPYVPSTIFRRATLVASGVANKLLLAFLLNVPDVSVQSPPEAGKICDITYYIATIPLGHRRRRSDENQVNITAKVWLFFILFFFFLLALFLIGNRNK